MLRQATAQPLVFNLSLHPYLMHAFRLKPLRRFFEHLKAQGDRVWLARGGDIVDAALPHLGPPPA
jgi:hypothetical protein